MAEDFYIKCNKCGRKTLVKADLVNYGYDMSVDEDRPMGDDVVYSYDGDICCESCGAKIDYCVSADEYPVNAFNFAIYECTGGEFVNEPKWEVDWEAYWNEDDWREYYERKGKKST